VRGSAGSLRLYFARPAARFHIACVVAQRTVHKLSVKLGERSYPILIGAGLLAQADVLAQAIEARDVLLVSNTNVAPLYAAPLIAALAPRRIVEAVLPDGEMHKTLASVARVIDVLVANRFARDSCVLALGGGVVGDIAGFAAATYQRGIAYVQAPTTLLAQVDSAVGGKTGVNHPGGKNLIGAFHQPRAVIADTSTLATLPPRELRAGLAEVIKYGMICDAEFFAWLEAHLEEVLAQHSASLIHVVRRCCEIKAEIVARDERETGDRALLNLGHTFGHAIEAASGYADWLHGEAVAAGLLMAADMSARAGLIPADNVARVRRLLERAGLVIDTRRIGATLALEHMRIDKKVKGGRVRLVLLRGIGHAFLTADYLDATLRETLATYFG
jgi:3-dehydroquinate synthase